MGEAVTSDAFEQVKEWYIGDAQLPDPYPMFGELRGGCPVAHSERFDGYYLVTDYQSQHQVLKDPTTFPSSILWIPPIEDPVGKYIPLQINPPDLQAYRAAFGPFFAPSMALQMEEPTRRRAQDLVAAFVAKGGGDFVTDFCIPYPVITILLHLGLPVEDMELLLGWKESIIREGLSGDPDRIAVLMSETYPAVIAYYNRVLDDRSAMTDPPDDILTGLVQAHFRERPFTRDEMVRSLHLFFQAGLDTVTSLLSLSMHYLAAHPDKMKQLSDRPDLVPSAVEELLRYHSPVTVCRSVSTDTELAGVPLKAGDQLMLPTASSGRDEAFYGNADEVDFERTPNRHLAFGGGPHRCIGSHIARMELRVALEEIVAAMPRFALDESSPPERHYGGIFGFDHLLLSIGGC